jgi:hypothetical protein
MSQTIDYFFNYQGKIADLAAEVEILFGARLDRAEGSDTHFGRLLGIEFSLYEHDYNNDHGIPFEQYRYCASTRTALPDVELRPLQVTIAAAIPYLFFRGLGVTGMLVFDLQHLVAAYSARESAEGTEALFNAASGLDVRIIDNCKLVSERLHSRAFTSEAEHSTDEYRHGAGH